jgi:hypothetical protein
MPYAPTVNDHSGALLAAGIMNAGGSITDAITRSQADAKRLKAIRAMAVDGLGMDPEQVDKMDEGTLQGHLESIAVRNVMGQMQERNQRQQFAAEDQQFQRAAAARAQTDADYQGEQRKAIQAMMADFNGVGPTGPVAPNMDPQSIMSSAARHGVAMDPATLARFMQTGGDAFFNRGDADKATPIAPGFLRAVLGPNSAQIIPDMATAGTAVPITSPTGDALGYGLPGRSGVTPLKTGDVTDKDRFAALQAEKRALIAAKSRVFAGKDNENWKAFDDSIAALDEELKQLQSGKAKPAGKANDKDPLGLFQ